jgi:hypothetical protein
MLEIIIVVLIVAVAAIMAAKSFHRTLTGKNDGCKCTNGCHSCTCKDFVKTYRAQDADK